jgi:D-alanyl-lipoteichoic acid acyltransferase DltB (MBOAT superfamily)
MNVTSINFLIFVVVTFFIYQVSSLLRSVHVRDIVLLAANGYFLSTFNTQAVTAYIPMAVFILLGYIGSYILHKQKSALSLRIFLILTLAYFFWIKKYSFVPSQIFLLQPYVTIGLSYMFFRMLQLQIDAAGGNLEHFPNPVTYLNYILNFSTLISGPIQRYESYAQYREHPLQLNWIAFGKSLERIASGAFKVVVLAALLYGVHQDAQSALQTASPISQRVVVGTAILVSYTLYLYCNFSGYTDIVIGVARFFGNELPENFDRPFSATNFMDFWARWHMTLSNWVKTYVYNPFAASLMKRFPSSTADPYIGVAAFMVTFFLIGLWHGQTAVFVLYGLVLGLGVSGNKLFQVLMIKKLGRKSYRNLASHWLYQACARGLTFCYFCFSLLLFWASWHQIEGLVNKLGGQGLVLVALAIFLSATILLDGWERLRNAALQINIRGQILLLSRYLRTVFVTAAVLITIAVLSLATTPAPDIVYKNF